MAGVFEQLKKIAGLDTSKKSASESTNISLNEVLSKYQVLDVVEGTDEHGPFVIVGDDAQAVVASEAKPGLQFKESPQLGEMASSSPSPFTGSMRSEYNQKLQGLNGLMEYDKMRKSDGVCSGILLTIKTPVHAGHWSIKPNTSSQRDKNAAEFVWKCLTEYQSITWTQILQEAMLCADFGYYIFEKVWETRVIDGVERTVLKKLAPRHPMDVKEVKYDSHGGPKSVVFFVKTENFGQKEVEVSIKKLLIITFNREANDVTGRSVLRTAYQHYFFKTQLYKIDAIQKERHGIGIPVIKLPVGFDRVKDVQDANALGRNLRTNERAHVVLPPNWEIFFAKLEGQPVDALKSIEYHDSVIRESILAGFTGADRVTNEDDLGLFLKSTRFIANSICDAFNTYLIPELIAYNYDRVGTPKLQVRQIGEQGDMRTLSMAIRNLVGAGIIRPDDRLEAWIRDLMDLPEVDLATVRMVKAPQASQVSPESLPNATPGTKTELPDQEQDGSGKENPATNTPGLPRQTPLPPVGVGGSRVGDGKGQR